MGQCGGALGRGACSVHEALEVVRTAFCDPASYDVEAADDARQHIVEVMGQATRQLANRFHLLALPQLLFQLLALPDVSPGQEKLALFTALLQRELEVQSVALPDWVGSTLDDMVFAGNVRELANLVERVALLYKREKSWDSPQIRLVFERFASVGLMMNSQPALAVVADNSESEFSTTELAERERIIEALERNAWRRQDSAADLGISRKVLWEKMRKLDITEQGERSEV